jgi:hypothetical protein
LFFATGIVSFSQQVERQVVVLEIGTGTWCQFCPGATFGAHGLLENQYNVAVVKNQNNDTWANPFSNARNTYYNLSAYPCAKFDGVITYEGGAACPGSLYPSYLPLYQQRIDSGSAFTMNVDFTRTNLAMDVTVYIEKVAIKDSSNCVVHLILTESDIPAVWYCLTDLDNVNRMMVPNENGTPLNLTGDQQVINLDFNLDPTWVPENCELVAFIQNNTTKEIYQATKSALKSMAVSADTIHFDTAFINYPVSEEYILWNRSDDTLWISEIQVSNPDFTLDTNSFYILPYMPDTLFISFLTDDTGPATGVVTFSTSDDLFDEITVILNGNAIEPPEIEVSPASYYEVLIAGDTLHSEMTIENNGNSNLEYSIDIDFLDLPLLLQMSAPDDMWTVQYKHALKGASEAGAESDGEYLYTAQWSGSNFYKYDLNGNLLSTFTITGCSNVRDLAYDGTYYYGSQGNTTVYIMDFTNKVLVGTITAPTAVRAIAYNDDLDAFYANNWSTSIYLFDRTGTTLATFPVVTYANYYGFAYDNFSAGGPFLWGFCQEASGSKATIVQMHASTCIPTGITRNVQTDMSTTQTAGGLFIQEGLFKGKVTIGGVAQSCCLFGYELTDITWLRFNPIAGTLPPEGSAADVDALFDARYFDDGVYHATIHVNSNDPANPQVSIPAVLKVLGTPEIETYPDTLCFDTTYIGYPDTLPLEIANTGTDTLTITQVTYSNDDYSSTVSGFIVLPDDEFYLPVQFDSETVGWSNGYMIIQSDDTTNLADTVYLEGYGIFPPVIEVSVTSLSDSLFTGDTVHQSFTITNSGQSRLDWAIDIDEGPTDFVLIGTGTSTNTSVPTNTYNSYAWSESIYLNSQMGDIHKIGKIAYYITTCQAGRQLVNQKIWMKHTTLTSYANANYPDPSNNGYTLVFDGSIVLQPNAWLEIPLTTPFYYNGVDNLLICYENRDGRYVQINTSWMYTWSDNRVKFKDSSSGFPNSAGTRASYLPNIRLYNSFWVECDPDSGSIPAETRTNSTQIDVLFDAVPLVGGLYQTTMNISSNDPEDHDIEIPVTLFVTGFPEINTTPDTLDYDTVFIGYPDTTLLHIVNSGTDTLFMSSISSTNVDFLPDTNSYYLLAYQSIDLPVIFSPSVVGSRTGYLIIQHNDATDPPDTTVLKGVGLYPPEIEVSVSSLADSLIINDTTHQTFTITNEGQSRLDWNIDIEFPSNRFREIGTGNVTNSNVPLYTYYGYSWSEAIYLKDEILNKKTIDKISYHTGNSGSNLVMTNQKIWMKHTSLSSYTSNAYPDPANNGYTLVFDGSVTFNSNQWITIPLTTPFEYNGTDNLLICYENRRGTNYNQYCYFYYTDKSNRVKYKSQSGSFPTGTGYITSWVPNIRLHPEFWITCNPSQGSIQEGARDNETVVDVMFDAGNDLGGLYQSQINVHSNDPETPLVEIPVEMLVTGFPTIVTSPDTIVFDTVYVGYNDSKTLTVKNTGTDTLFVTQVSPETSDFTPDTTHFWMLPYQQYSFPVVFNPVTVGNKDAWLFIHSNDTLTAIDSIWLMAHCVYSPDIDISPSSFSENLTTADTSHQSLYISNEGLGTLDWDLNMIGNDFTSKQIGSGTNTYRSHCDASVQYSWSENIYLASDIGCPMVIKKIAYRTSGGPASLTLNNQKIYMKNATMSAYTDAQYPDPEENGYQLVYDGTLTWITNVWNEIVLDVPFYYNGTDNLLICYENWDGEWFSSYPGFYCSSVSTTRWRWNARDLTFPYVNGSLANYIVNVQLFAENWLAGSPLGNIIPPGGITDTVDIRFSAENLIGGTFQTNIHIASNDSTAIHTYLPVSLTVTGQPEFFITQDTVSFDTVFVGYSKTIPIPIKNTGTDTLLVTGIAASRSMFTASPTSFYLAPNHTKVIAILFQPTSQGSQSTDLIISSNDPDNPHDTLYVEGYGLLPPVIEVTPDTIEQFIASGDTVHEILTISNTGDSPLEYELNWVTQNPNKQKLIGTGTNTSYNLPFCSWSNYSWSEVIYLASDIGGAKRIEKIAFKTASSGSNITRNNQKIYMKHTTLTSYPDASYPNPAVNGYTLVYEGTVTFNQEVWVEISLDRSFDYNGTDNLMICIENWDGSSKSSVYFRGLNTSYRAKYNTYAFRTGTTTMFIPNIQIFYSDWLDLSPVSGVIPAGRSETEVDVRFDADSLFSGNYLANIIISSNDPANEEVVVPVNMEVDGYPIIAVTPDTLDFDTLYVGNNSQQSIQVYNNGTDTLSVSNIQTDCAGFSFNKTSFKVPPYQNTTVTITFAPTQPVSCLSFLNIYSNDSTVPAYPVQLYATALNRPEIEVFPDSIYQLVPAGDSTNQDLLIINDIPAQGGTDLTWSLSTSYIPVEVGNNTTSAENYPVNVRKKWSYSECIYRSQQIGGPMKIYKIAYHTAASNWDLVWENQKIYMKHTTDTAIYSPAYPNPTVNGYSLVFEGTITYNPNSWIEITLDQPFNYNGADNLLIEYENYYGSYTILQNTFFYYTYTPYYSVKGDWNNFWFPAEDGWLDYVLPNIRFYSYPWIICDTTNGTVPPGYSADTVHAELNASQLAPNTTYYANIKITSNDPDEATIDIPVQLDVFSPEPDIEVRPVTVSFDTAYIGFGKDLPIKVINNGILVLSVDSLLLANPVYSTDSTSLTVPPGDSTIVTLSFDPVSVGVQTDNLTFYFNDPDDSVLVVPVWGYGLLPPDIEIVPDTLELITITGLDVEGEIIVKNEGTGQLRFNAQKGHNWLTLIPASDAIEPGDSIFMEVAVDAGMIVPPGLYTSSITFTTNDPDELLLVVPLIVHVQDYLDVEATATPSSICLGTSSQLFAEATGGYMNYQFTWSSIPSGFSSTLQNPVMAPLVNTTYFVTVTDGSDVAQSSVDVDVFYFDPPSAPANMLPPVGSIDMTSPILFAGRPAPTHRSTTSISGLQVNPCLHCQPSPD